MVAGLLEEVEKILSGDVFEHEKKYRTSLQSAMKSDDVRMRWDRLVNRSLQHACESKQKKRMKL